MAWPCRRRPKRPRGSLRPRPANPLNLLNPRTSERRSVAHQRKGEGAGTMKGEWFCSSEEDGSVSKLGRTIRCAAGCEPASVADCETSSLGHTFTSQKAPAYRLRHSLTSQMHPKRTSRAKPKHVDCSSPGHGIASNQSRFGGIQMSRVMLALLLGATVAQAADQTILGNQLLVKNPSTPEKRQVSTTAKEKASPDTLVGDPTANGATLTVRAEGATPTEQTFSLPQGTNAKGKPLLDRQHRRRLQVQGLCGRERPGEERRRSRRRARASSR